MICVQVTNTAATVLSAFRLNNLVGQPTTDGTFFVLKPEEFDRANEDLSRELLDKYNIHNRLWVRVGNTARLSATVGRLVDVVASRTTENPSSIVESLESSDLPALNMYEGWVNPCG